MGLTPILIKAFCKQFHVGISSKNIPSPCGRRVIKKAVDAPDFSRQPLPGPSALPSWAWCCCLIRSGFYFNKGNMQQNNITREPLYNLPPTQQRDQNSLRHSSELRSLRSTKCSRGMRQNFLYFLYEKTVVFSLMNSLAYVDIDQVIYR